VIKAVIEAAVDEMFAAFEDNVVDAARGLYFHTDDGRMRNLFVYLEAQLGYHPSIFPFEVGQEAADASARGPSLVGVHVVLTVSPRCRLPNGNNKLPTGPLWP
jgi:hypothetical protein